MEFKKLPSVKVNINNVYELRNKHVVMYDKTFWETLDTTSAVIKIKFMIDEKKKIVKGTKTLLTNLLITLD